MVGASRRPSHFGKEKGITQPRDSPKQCQTLSRNRSDASHSDILPAAAQRKSDPVRLSEIPRQSQVPERKTVTPPAVSKIHSWSVVKQKHSVSTKRTTPSVARSLLSSTSRGSSASGRSTSNQSWPSEVSTSDTSRQSWPTERIGLSAISRPSWGSTKVTQSGTTRKTWSSTKVAPTEVSKVAWPVGRYSSSAITKQSWPVRRSPSMGTRRSWLSGRYSCSVMTKARPSTKRCPSAVTIQSWPSLKLCNLADKRQELVPFKKPSEKFRTPVEITHIEHLIHVPKTSLSDITRPPSWSSVKAPQKTATTKQLWPTGNMTGNTWISTRFSPQTVTGHLWTAGQNAMPKPYWVSAKICPPPPQKKCPWPPTRMNPEPAPKPWSFTPVAMTAPSWPYAHFGPPAAVTGQSWPSPKINPPIVTRQCWPTAMMQYNPPAVARKFWQPQKICPHSVMGQPCNPPRLTPPMTRNPWNPSCINPPAVAGVLWASARIGPPSMPGNICPPGKGMPQQLMRQPWPQGRNCPQTLINVPWPPPKMTQPAMARYFGPAFMNSPSVPWQSSPNHPHMVRQTWPSTNMFPQTMAKCCMFPSRNYPSAAIR